MWWASSVNPLRITNLRLPRIELEMSRFVQRPKVEAAGIEPA
jgi:hypothetical protein